MEGEMTAPRIRAALLASAALGLVMSAASARAQSAAASTAPESKKAADTSASVEAVVVTARRKVETLFDVPAPVTAITGATIRAFDITDMKTFMDLIPNAELPKDPENYNLYINIRGIQETDNNAAPNFGIYRNGIYAGGQRPQVGSLIDVSRVEVDAGPQGGLYGRDAVGGAINVVYNTPQPTPGGYLTAAYGRYNYSEVQGAINMPIDDKLAVRLTGWNFNQTQGELYNATLHQQVDAFLKNGARFSAKYTPSNNLTATWMVEYDNDEGPATEAYGPNGVTNGTIVSPKESPGVIYRDTPDRSHSQQAYVSQDIRYQTGFGVFDWSSSFSHWHLNNIEDEDKTALSPTAGPDVVQDALSRREQTTNVYTELDYFSPEDKPVTVTAGISYFDQIFKFGNDFHISADLDYFGIPEGVVSADFLAPTAGSSISTRSTSAFGQAVWKINSQWSLTGGLRYTNDQESLNYLQVSSPDSNPTLAYIFADVVDVFPNLSLSHNYTFTNVSPSAELNYKPNDHVNLYALYGTGFRAGGFNLTTTSVALIPYNSELAQNYEVGAKTQWLDGRLGMNLAVFYMTQTHLLTYNPDPSPAAAALGFYYLSNVGAAGTYGVEYTGTAKLTSWWNAALSVGWLDAKITKGVSYGESEAGQPLENTRTWTFDLRSNVDYPIQNGYRLLSGVNWQIDSGGYLDLTNLPWATEDRLDLTLGVAKDKTKLVVYGNNVLDSRPTDFVYGDGARTLVDGATYGVRVTTEF
jgi:iron complex outermembrane receptor protein